MAKALVLSICVLLVCAGAATARMDVWGWLNATGEVRVESWFTMGEFAIHRWLAVDGEVSNYGVTSYRDQDGNYATQRFFTASGEINSLNEVVVDRETDTGSLYLWSGSHLVGSGLVSVNEGNQIADMWSGGGMEISGLADPAGMSFRIFVAGSGVNVPADVYASAWTKCVGESATAWNLIEFWVSQGESPVLDGGWDVVISNESFTIWQNPYIGASSW